MSRRFQVFVSSTYEDLKLARQEISWALLQVNCFPAGMELFPSVDEEQFAYIKEVIEESDYYILVSAGRYGSIEPTSGLSYTEMEYDYATSLGKPVIRLLHRDPFGSLRGSEIERRESKKKKLKAFREKVSSSRLVSFWDSELQLGKLTILGILEAQRRFPRAGWVREAQHGLRRQDDITRNEVEGHLGALNHAEMSLSVTEHIVAEDSLGRETNLLRQFAIDLLGELSEFVIDVSRGSKEIFDASETREIKLKAEKISQRANQALAYLAEVSVFSLSIKSTLQLHNVVDIVCDLKILLARIAGSSIAVVILTELSSACAHLDRRLFETALINLVVNARDASPQDGEIVLSVQRRVVGSPFRAHHLTVAPGVYVSVSVADAGRGVSANELVNVFKPFYSSGRTKRDRNGLGLSVVLSAIEKMNGYVFVERRVPKGSVFTILLPEAESVSI